MPTDVAIVILALPQEKTASGGWLRGLTRGHTCLSRPFPGARGGVEDGH